jgi:hypothetical protein
MHLSKALQSEELPHGGKHLLFRDLSIIIFVHLRQNHSEVLFVWLSLRA